MPKGSDFIEPEERKPGWVSLDGILAYKGMSDRRLRFVIQGAAEKCAAEGHAWTKHGHGRVCPRCWAEEE